MAHDEKIQISSGNWFSIFKKWHNEVAPQIDVDWEAEGNIEILFFLADIFPDNNVTTTGNLGICLRPKYWRDIKDKKTGASTCKEVTFKDHGQAHKNFWDGYVRPPSEEVSNSIEWNLLTALDKSLRPTDDPR